MNAALGFAILPSVPFGGVGASGFGRIHGPEGLKEFAYPHAIVRKRLPAPLNATSFTRTREQDSMLASAMKLVHGRKK